MNNSLKQGSLSATRHFKSQCCGNAEATLWQYLRKDCINKDGKLCDFCRAHDWVGPSQERIPQPVPDPNNPGHYMKPFETPTSRRFLDDWQPRVYIKKEFSNGNLQTETDIDRFATKFAVDPKLVKDYVQHLNDLKDHR